MLLTLPIERRLRQRAAQAAAPGDRVTASINCRRWFIYNKWSGVSDVKWAQCDWVF